MNYELKYLSLKEAIGKAFNLYMDNFVPLFLISLIVDVPYLFWLYLEKSSGLFPNGNSGFNPAVSFVSLFAAISLEVVRVGLITEIVSKRYLGFHTSMDEYLQSVLPRVLPLVGLTLLCTLAVGIGFMLLIVPGIIAALSLSLSNPIFIIERKGIKEAMNRSWELTKGYRGTIFSWFLVMGIIVIILNGVIGGVSGFTLYFFVSDPTAITNIISYSSQIIASVISPVSCCFIILLYFNLRIKKEGFALEHLAEHFSLSLEQENEEIL